MIREITIIELVACCKINSKIRNVLKKNGILSVQDIFDHFEEYNTFINLDFCGEKLNREIVEIHNKMMRIEREIWRARNISGDDILRKRELLENLGKISGLTECQKQLISQHIKSKKESAPKISCKQFAEVVEFISAEKALLETRSSNILQAILKEEQAELLKYIYGERNIENIRFAGKKTTEPIKRILESTLEFIENEIL